MRGHHAVGERARRPVNLRLFFLAPLLSGALLVLGYPPFGQTWAGWVALVPLLAALEAWPERRREAWRWGYLFGLVYFGGVFWWIGHVTVAGTIALVLYLALYPALWLWWLQRRRDGASDLRARTTLRYAFAGACGWVVLEWWRGWFLTGFTWNYLGVTQHGNVPMLQLAGLGGVHLLSWLLVFAQMTAARTLWRFGAELRREIPMRPHYEFSVMMVLVAVAFAYGFRASLRPVPGEFRQLRYACVQANIPQSAKYQDQTVREILAKHVRLTEFAAASKPDLVLWPETATGQKLYYDPDFTREVFAISREADFYFLFGGGDQVPPDQFNSAFLVGPREGAVSVYHKSKLVIFGEYTPLVEYLPVLRRLVPFSVDYAFGTGPVLFALPERGVRLAPLICFEDTLPAFTRAAGRMNPDALVNITNDAWFKDSPGAEQHLANAVFRCVELDLPMIRAANSGVTCEVTAKGVVRQALADADGRRLEVEGVLNGVLEMHPSRVTFYERCGDWIVLISAAGIGMVLASRARKTRQL
jgi:apolipoprotein N-acyltransferase